jgi:hypothetical protein
VGGPSREVLVRAVRRLPTDEHAALRASRLVRWHVAGEPTRVAPSTRVGDRTYYLVYVEEGRRRPRRGSPSTTRG